MLSEQTQSLCSWKTVSQEEAGRTWGPGGARVCSGVVSMPTLSCVWQKAVAGLGGKAQSDVRLTMLTQAALRRTEQTVRCPEWRLRAQAGVSRVVPAASCGSSSQLSYNLFQGRLFWCLETPLLGSRKPSRAQKAPTFPSTCFPFLWNPIKCAHTSLFPRHHSLPQSLSLPTLPSYPIQIVLGAWLTNLSYWFSLRCNRPVWYYYMTCPRGISSGPLPKECISSNVISETTVDWAQSMSRTLGASQKLQEKKWDYILQM